MSANSITRAKEREQIAKAESFGHTKKRGGCPSHVGTPSQLFESVPRNANVP